MALNRIFVHLFIASAMFYCSEQLSADSRPPSATACPAPDIDTKAWEVVILNDCGVRFRLPKRYKEHKWDVVVNNALGHSYQAESFDRIDLTVRRSPDSNLDRQKTRRQIHYEDFSECREMMGGRETVLQSFRGGGTVMTTDGQRFQTYHAEGLWELRAGQLLRISGDFMTRESQEELLAILRTVEFIR